jgi:chorismate mutase
METLEDMRKSIDNIDNAIVAMFAERFKVTDRVGHFKAQHQLEPKDTQREASQFNRIVELADQYGLDPDFATSYLRAMIERVIERHKIIVNNQL